MDVFDLTARISVDTKPYEDGMNDASKKSKSFGSKIGSGLKSAAKVGAVALTAVTTAGAVMSKTLFNGVDAVAEYGDNVDKMSQKMGISAKAYQEWDAVLQHSGTSIEALKPSMKTLATQAQKNAEEFQKLGISQQEVANLSQEDLFAKVITGLQNMEEGTERTAITSKLLGRGAVELGALLNTSAEETQKMKDRVHELGGVMSDEGVKASAKFKDNLQDLQTAFAGIKRGISSQFLPSMNDLMEGFTKLLAGEEGAEKMLDSGMNKLDSALNNIMPKIGSLLETLLPRIIEFGGKLVVGFAEQVPKILVALAKQIPTIAKQLLSAIKKILPEMLKAGVEIIKELAKGMSNSGEIVKTVIEIFNTVITTITENLPDIIDAGLDIVMGLVDGIINNLDLIVNAILQGIVLLINAIVTKLPDILAKGKDIILNLVQGIVDNIPNIVTAIIQAITTLIQTITEHLPDILTAGVDILLELINGLLKAIPQLIAAVPQIITALVQTLLSGDMIAKLLQAGLDMIGKIFEGIMNGDFIKLIGDVIKALLGAVVGAAGALLSIGAKIVSGILDGIKAAWNTVVNWVESGIEALFGNPLEKYQDPNYKAPEVVDLDDLYKKGQARQAKRNMQSGSQSMADIARRQTTNVYVGNQKTTTVVTDATARSNNMNGGR